MKRFVLALSFFLSGCLGAFAQGTVPGQYMVPLGHCQISSTSLASAVKLSSCTWASFTGTGSGTNLSVTSVTGIIAVGETVSGVGVPTGTTIVSQTSGTPGGAGVYVTSVATTSNAASLTTTGLPSGQVMAMLQAESANIRYLDDGVTPTSSVGELIVDNLQPMLYTGTVANLQFIAVSGSPILDVLLYRQ